MRAIGNLTLAILTLGSLLAAAASGAPEALTIPPDGALDGHRHRVIVSTDIGGTDPDDFQSMVHLLVYADVLDLEGLISSPPGPGRKADILKVIDVYARDFAPLRTHSNRYPAPAALTALTRQGATEPAPYAGVRGATEGSEWLVRCARREDPRPLHVLVWGGLEDLAQALHDAPDIRPRLRVYWIGGPNKKWSPDAYHYLATHHPALWIIEANATYRGWFTGGTQSGAWGNQEYVARSVTGHGALGAFFGAQLGGRLKMGDTPSVGWLLRGSPADPTQPGWGGQFVRAWERPYVRLGRLPSSDDRVEVFGIVEFVLPLGDPAPASPEAWLEVENQSLAGQAPGDGTLRFRFCPKAAAVCRFRIRGNVASLDGRTGAITVIPPSPDRASQPSANHPHWWTDNPAPAWGESGHLGARTVSCWREAFLEDFARRMRRCDAPETR